MNHHHSSGSMAVKGGVLLTHPGTQYSYKLAEQLEKQGLLFRFATGLAFGQDSRWLKLLPARWRKKMQRRQVCIPARKVFSLPGVELRALVRQRRGENPEQVFYDRNQRFQQQLPQRLIEEASVVIGFDTSSWILQERCRRAGKPFILDASIAHPLSQQTVFQLLRNRFPAWQGQLVPKPASLVALEQSEMQTADAIVVASEFTRSTYLEHGLDPRNIYINHYGTDHGFFRSKWDNPKPRRQGPVRFLFFSKLSVRKGFPWLCEVWKAFSEKHPNAQLETAGYGVLPPGFTLPAGISLRGFVHPQDRVALLHHADVFVFPSYFEGFAQVIIEAMAAGLPVITTTATVGPEIIENGAQGFIIEPGDDRALAAAMEYFVQHPESIETMGRSARQNSQQLTWDAYGERWHQIVEKVTGSLPGAKK